MVIDELRDLRYFVEVARCNSFSLAATRLSVSTGAVSKAVSRLEQDMEVPLFVRASRSIRLSSEGQHLLHQAEASFETLERALGEFRESRDSIVGVVQLSTFSVFGKSRLAPLLPEFLATYPRVDLIIGFHDSQRGMSRDSYDIRITWGERLDEDKIAHTLCDLPLFMVGSPAYLVARGTPQTVADLADHDCINALMPGGARGRWAFTPVDGGAEGGGADGQGEREEARVFSPKGRISVTDELGNVMDLARQGLGLTLYDAHDAQRFIADGSLVRVLPHYRISSADPLQGQAVMQYRRRQQLSPAARALVDFLIARFAGEQGPVLADAYAAIDGQ